MDKITDILDFVSGIQVEITWFLILSVLMMFIGVYGFLTRRNTLALLVSLELMLNATDINFTAFNRLLFADTSEGYMFMLFAVAISRATETAVAIAVMINIYRNIKNNYVGNLNKMKW